MAEPNVNIRIAAQGDQAVAEFRRIAEAGDRDLRKLETAGVGASAGLGKLGGSLAGAGTAISGFAAGLVGAVAGVASLSAAVSAGVNEFAGSERAFLNLQSVLKATGNTTGRTAEQIDELSNQLERTTFATDDLVKTAATRLATFGSVSGDVFDEAIRLSQDLAAVFGGDVAGAAEKVGRALEDPVNGLIGLTREIRGFSPEVAKAAKELGDLGDRAGAQRAILEELQRTIGGAGEAEASGLSGAFDRASKATANLFATIAEASGFTGKLTSALEGLALKLDDIGERFKRGGISGALGLVPVFDDEKLAALQQELIEKSAELDKARAGPLAESPAVKEEIADLEQRIALLRQEADAIVAQARAREQQAIALKAAGEQAAAFDTEQKSIAAAEQKRAQDLAAVAGQAQKDQEAAEKRTAEAAARAAQQAEARAREEARARAAKVAAIGEEVSGLERLAAANEESAAAAEDVRITLEGERAARELGTGATDEERAAVAALVEERERLKATIEKTNDARAADAAAAKEAAADAKRQRERAAEDERQQQERLAAQQADLFLEPFREAFRDIQDGLAGAIRRALDGEITTVKDFFDTFLNIGKDTLAQLLSASILSPGGLVAGPGQAGGFGGGLQGLTGLFRGGGQTLGSFLPSLFGAAPAGVPVVPGGTGALGLGVGQGGLIPGLSQVSVSGLLGSAGLGALGGGLLAPLLGLDGTGGSIGGGLGAAVGFGFGGPLGAIAGGLLGTLGGGFLGNVFGSPQDNNAQFQFSLGSGRVGANRNTNADPANLSITQQIGNAALQLREQLEGLGATFNDFDLELKAGLESGFGLRIIDNAAGRDVVSQSVGSAEELNAAALRAVIAQSSGGITDEQRRIAGISTATDAAGLLADIAVPERIRALVHPVDQFGQAIRQLEKQFDDLAADAQRLGVSTDGLAEAREREIQRVRTQQIEQGLAVSRGRNDTLIGLGVIELNPLQQALVQLARQFADARRHADELGVTVEQLTAAEQRRRAELTAQFNAQQEAARQQTLLQLGVRQLTPEQAALADAERQFAVARTQLAELGISLAELNEAHDRRIRQIREEAQAQRDLQLQSARTGAVNATQAALSGFDSLLSPLQGFRDQLAVSEGAGSPLERLASGRAQFLRSVADAQRDGTTAEEVNSVIALGQSLLSASRDVNASGGGFARDFQLVNRTILELQRDVRDQRDDFLNSIPAELRAQGDRQADQLRQLIEAAHEQVRQFQQLVTEMRGSARRRTT